MNRIAYMVIKSLPFVPAWFYRVCRLGRDQDPHTEQERYDYLRKLVKRVNKSGRVAIEVHGRDNLPAADGFIMFPNHQGLFDVLAVIEGCPHQMGVDIPRSNPHSYYRIILSNTVIGEYQDISGTPPNC